MVNGRMIRISRYINRERLASYKEIADALDIKERLVRYDVDSINDELSFKRMDLIKKYPRGMLFVPDKLDLSLLITEAAEFVFSPGERLAVIRLLILFSPEKLNIRKLTEQLCVSRRSIQNDMDAVQKEIRKYQLELKYNQGFSLCGETEMSYRLRSDELKQYVAFLYQGEPENLYEAFMASNLRRIFLPVRLDDILKWIDTITETMGWVFSDESYQWYVANVLAFTWYLVRNIPVPETRREAEGEVDEGLPLYEQCIGRALNRRERGILSGLTRYTNRYVHLDVHSDLIMTEDIVLHLVRRMGSRLHIGFARDGILMKGLLNHIVPMLERVKGNVQLDEAAASLIPEEYLYVCHTLNEVLSEVPVLNNLTENEKNYLAIYFMGSLRRMQQERYLTVLLICGFGYGTTAVIKDALLNEYQVYVKECIPAYKVSAFQKWNQVDAVISTVKVELPVRKPFARVHVLLNNEDYVKLNLLGLRRKHVLTDYFAIERRLGFLSSADRSRVMEIMKEELGFREVRMPAKYYKVSDLLGIDDILCVERVKDWKEAVRISTLILENKDRIGGAYYHNIIQGIRIQGFYSITNNKFALLHGSENAGVKVSCMSLLLSREPVYFGEKSVHIIFCLASKDKKEHVPAVIRLMRMSETTNFTEVLQQCSKPGQIMDMIEKCEREVEECYQF